jgi:hypothetical protein
MVVAWGPGALVNYGLCMRRLISCDVDGDLIQGLDARCTRLNFPRSPGCIDARCLFDNLLLREIFGGPKANLGLAIDADYDVVGLPCCP